MQVNDFTYILLYLCLMHRNLIRNWENFQNKNLMIRNPKNKLHFHVFQFLILLFEIFFASKTKASLKGTLYMRRSMLEKSKNLIQICLRKVLSILRSRYKNPCIYAS
jgi:hypothetical protein